MAALRPIRRNDVGWPMDEFPFTGNFIRIDASGRRQTFKKKFMAVSYQDAKKQMLIYLKNQKEKSIKNKTLKFLFFTANTMFHPGG